jgi:hypothetical protein
MLAEIITFISIVMIVTVSRSVSGIGPHTESSIALQHSGVPMLPFYTQGETKEFIHPRP